jgi:sterol desaturase/sphingolipid hydroxylase (fatty acid hydroxylase superfamily)
MLRNVKRSRCGTRLSVTPSKTYRLPAPSSDKMCPQLRAFESCASRNFVSADLVEDFEFTMEYQDTKSAFLRKPKESHLVGLGLGKANYWFTFVADSGTVVFLLFWDRAVLRTSVVLMVAGFAVGLFSWSLLEYWFHRLVYHKGRTPAHAGHKIHHQNPKAPIAMPWFVVTGLFGSVWFVFGYLHQAHFVLSFEGGLLSGFVIYGAVHHVLHHFNFKSLRFRRLRAHHFVHHRTPNVNFGVTSRVWDHAFGTMQKQEAKKHTLAGAAHS